MTFQKSFVSRFARVSMLLALIHLIGESYFTYVIGQSLVQILADGIAITLLLFGGMTSIKNPKTNGILCGAWGFALCLNYRAFAWRLDEIMSGNHDIALTFTFYILCVALCISALFFILSLLLNLPKTVIE